MEQRIIPFDGRRFPDRFPCVLDGETYVFRSVWNARARAYYVSIYDAQRRPIRLNCRLVPNWPLFASTEDERLPAGRFVVVDNGQGPIEPGDLGSRVQVHYFSGGDE